jgi:hypothetical protein
MATPYAYTGIVEALFKCSDYLERDKERYIHPVSALLAMPCPP